MAGVNASLATAMTHPALSLLADVNDNKVTPGLLGFVVFAALGTAVWLLMKSMNKQFKKVNFEVEPDPRATPEPEPGSGPEDRAGAGTPGQATADAGK